MAILVVDTTRQYDSLFINRDVNVVRISMTVKCRYLPTGNRNKLL